MTATYSPIAAPVRSAIRSAFALEGGLKPAVDWNFAGGVMPSALTFARASTATYYDASGTLVTAASGSPRLTYDPVTHAALGVFVEEQRTNLLTYSEALDNAAWNGGTVTTVTAAGVAPNGATTLNKLNANSTTASAHQRYQIGITLVSGNKYTAFVWMKQAEYSVGIVNLYDTVTGDCRTYFNLATGAVMTLGAGSTATCTAYFGGIYLCTVTRTVASTSGGLSVEFSNADNTPSFSAAIGSGIYAWGAQLEAGAFATSYIPTGASSATRAADVVTCTGAAFSQCFNSTEGTFVVEAVMPNANLGTANVLNLVYIGDGPGNEHIKVYQYETYFGAAIRHGGAVQADLSGTKTAGVVEKIAVAWAANDAAVAIRGSLVGTDATVALPTGIDRLTLGTGSTGALACTIKRVRYWRKRLTNAQLQALTA